ncbi:MAG TPA: glycosyltransferase family A protein [Vicinamibacterales bacterium]|nr:glycosyltransferase family A protein [Vicinamibacterales bacterium]
MTPTWDVLICSIEHRTDMLADLLTELERQHVPGFGVRVFRDNLETVYGDKCQRLLDSSNADYISFLDDDDWIEPDFVATIMQALEQRPDYVGFKVRYTKDGNPQIPVFHTLKFGGWVDSPDALYRDIVHFNPIRCDLALMGKWEGGDGADRRWANQLRDLGCVRNEVFIDRELHHYRNRTWDTFTLSSLQEPLTEHPPRPDADWVTWLT